MKIIPQLILQPARIISGLNAILNVHKEATNFGCRGIIVHGSSFSGHPLFPELKQNAGLGTCFYHYHDGEPDMEELRKLLGLAKNHGCDWITGIGGGSVIDLAKATAALYNAVKDPAYYQQGGKLETKGIPCIAAPSTAGTGSEVTKNSVITNTETMEKLSIRDDSFVPRIVILDPSLIMYAPGAVIAHSGMDALTQAIESYFSRGATRFSDFYALEAFRLLSGNLEKAYLSSRENESTLDENTAFSLLSASCFAGTALAHARLGFVHGIAHPLGIYYHQPHGRLCGFLLPYSLKLNKAHAAVKYDILSKECGRDLYEFTEYLNDTFQISNPFKGKDLVHKEKIIDYTLSSGSTKANPLEITREHIEALLTELF